jgi:hypothetical protein
MAATKMTKAMLKTGIAFYIPVNPEHINGSDPCNKDNCSLSRGGVSWLVSTFGGKASDYKVKSTNHGMTFVMSGRRYIAVFDTKTAMRIYNYDETYRRTRSKEKARATMKPFKARLMIEATQMLPKFPAMTDERKAYLRSLPKKRGPYVPKVKSGSRRELSL